jgi:DNA-binding MarR family transcriptional regulator
MSAQRFLWLFDQMHDVPMNSRQIAVMFVLLARDERGLQSITKAELGALIGVQERQVTNILKSLEEGLSLIETRRNGGKGKGRTANAYAIRPDATGNPVPATWSYRQLVAGC